MGDSKQPRMDIGEATLIVVKLAQSKWIWRAWRRHRLTPKEEQAIRIVSAWVEHGVYERLDEFINARIRGG